MPTKEETSKSTLLGSQNILRSTKRDLKSLMIIQLFPPSSINQWHCNLTCKAEETQCSKLQLDLIMKMFIHKRIIFSPRKLLDLRHLKNSKLDKLALDSEGSIERSQMSDQPYLFVIIWEFNSKRLNALSLKDRQEYPVKYQEICWCTLRRICLTTLCLKTQRMRENKLF